MTYLRASCSSLMNVMMEIRKCCNQLFLIRGAEERILAYAAASGPHKSEQDKPAIKGTVADGDTTSNTDWAPITAEQLAKPSRKIILANLLQKLRSGGHKVIIFSQMVCVLDFLEDLLRVKQSKYERLNRSKEPADVRRTSIH